LYVEAIWFYDNKIDIQAYLLYLQITLNAIQAQVHEGIAGQLECVYRREETHGP